MKCIIIEKQIKNSLFTEKFCFKFYIKKDISCAKLTEFSHSGEFLLV